MIKAEVVFDGDSMTINGFSICKDNDRYEVWLYGYGITNHRHLFTSVSLEQAVTYCLENKE